MRTSTARAMTGVFWLGMGFVGSLLGHAAWSLHERKPTHDTEVRLHCADGEVRLYDGLGPNEAKLTMPDLFVSSCELEWGNWSHSSMYWRCSRDCKVVEEKK